MTWNIVGNERTVALLRRALVAEQLSHAYLISGPESIGKRALALALARAVLCLQPNGQGDACGRCASCTRFEADSHPDLRTVELGAEQVQISRREIGQIQSDVALKPLLGQRKVYLLIEVERLSSVASNQLLKLLEEPPTGVMFLLTTADVGAVLPTIISRCQIVRLQPTARETIEAHLTSALEVAEDDARIIASLADGRMGWAIRAATEPALINARETAVGELMALLEQRRLARLLKAQELAGRWSGDRAGVIGVLDWWAATLRDLAVRALAPGAALPRTSDARLDGLRGRVAPEALIEAARAAQRTARLLEQNVNPRLALDTLVLDLPHPSPALL